MNYEMAYRSQLIGRSRPVARTLKYKTPTQQLSLRVPANVMTEIDRAAEQANRPRAEVVVELLAKAFPPVSAPAAAGVFG
jgi:hypothetical protein